MGTHRLIFYNIRTTSNRLVGGKMMRKLCSPGLPVPGARLLSWLPSAAPRQCVGTVHAVPSLLCWCALLVCYGDDGCLLSVEEIMGY